MMADKDVGPAPWNGQELLDANSQRIGTITGLAFPRRRFGTKWLLVETAGAHQTPVPLIAIRATGDRLVLPYPRSYVESGPKILNDQPLSQAEQRRLGLHYGFDEFFQGGTCCQTCGLCRVGKTKKAAR